MKVATLTAANGIEFTGRVVTKGESYGLNMCLTHDEDRPMLEFYDNRFPHTKYGQFVSRYYLSTVLDRNLNEGLCLDGGIPDWNIDGETMNEFVALLGDN